MKRRPTKRRRKTQAQKIMEARRAAYSKTGGSYADETDLLLLQQHYSELSARNRRPEDSK